ncbi:peroxisome biogenesis factor 10 isoform X3 [Mustelus asterias]
MPGLPVNQPQLIRSNQKDEYYLSSLRSYANEAFQIFAGAKRWLEWRKEIELLADLTYFSLTTVAGYQTLGEEYVNIVQVDSSGRRVPSPARRAALIILHTCVPYLLDRGLNRLEQDLQAENEGFRAAEHRQVALRPGLSHWLQGAVSALTAQQRKVLLQAVCVLRQAVSFLHRLHLGIFYLNGAFYHIAKRFTGITYLCVRGLFSDSVGLRWSYELLGKVSLLQLALTVAMQINSYRQRQRARQEWKLHRNLPCSRNKNVNRNRGEFTEALLSLTGIPLRTFQCAAPGVFCVWKNVGTQQLHHADTSSAGNVSPSGAIQSNISGNVVIWVLDAIQNAPQNGPSQCKIQDGGC